MRLMIDWVFIIKTHGGIMAGGKRKYAKRKGLNISKYRTMLTKRADRIAKPKVAFGEFRLPGSRPIKRGNGR